MRLASASDDRSIRLWDGSSGDLQAVLEGHSDAVTSLAWSPDGSLLATGSSDRRIRLWDTASGEDHALPAGHYTAVTSLAWSPDGKWLVSGSGDFNTGFWDVESRSLLMFMPNVGQVTDIAWSPDGKTFATAMGNGELRLWAPFKIRPRATLGGQDGTVSSIAWSAGGATLAAGLQAGGVQLWDVADYVPGASLNGPIGPVYNVAWSPDGKTLASVKSRDPRLLDAASGQVLKTLRTRMREVTAIAWSPDSKTLATGMTSGDLLLWDAVGSRQGEIDASPRRKLVGHRHEVVGVAWSPDGSILASASPGSVRLWDAATGQPRALPELVEAGDGWFASVAWSPDGSTLALGSAHKWVRTWNVSPVLALTERLRAGDPTFLAERLAAYPFRLEGIDLVYDEPPRLWIAEPPPPAWSESHPFHWLNRAMEGDAEAMSELGLIYHRANDHARALHWYQRAIVAGAGEAVRNRELDLRRQEQRGFEAAARAAARDGRIDAAIQTLEQARGLQTALPLSAPTSNTICWFGSLADRADAVLRYCESGAAAYPNLAYLRDSLGIARALSGDLDGASDAIRYFVEHAEGEEGEMVARRRAWLVELAAGRNPIDEAELEALRNE